MPRTRLAYSTRTRLAYSFSDGICDSAIWAFSTESSCESFALRCSGYGGCLQLLCPGRWRQPISEAEQFRTIGHNNAAARWAQSEIIAWLVDIVCAFLLKHASTDCMCDRQCLKAILCRNPFQAYDFNLENKAAGFGQACFCQCQFFLLLSDLKRKVEQPESDWSGLIWQTLMVHYYYICNYIYIYIYMHVIIYDYFWLYMIICDFICCELLCYVLVHVEARLELRASRTRNQDPFSWS